jgi:hypothetical protein
MGKLRKNDIEIAVARFFNHRINIIVPNVFWGLGLYYEADLLIVTPSGYVHEIEIKVSAADIKAEKNKSSKAHTSKKIHRFSFAVPDYLVDCEYLPTDCGLIAVDKDLWCRTIRPPRLNKAARKLTEVEIKKLLHLGCMRIWSLKEVLSQFKKRLYTHAKKT